LKSKIARWFDKRRRHAADPCEPAGIRSFSDDQKKEDAFESRERGVRTVALDRIVGSVGRYQDFDGRFRPKAHVPSERLQRVREAMRAGRVMAPVTLYQIKDEYYVLDGNHRIAVAKELGHDEILAQIVEFIPSAANLKNILYRERAEFADRTGLSVEIQLTEIHQYRHLVAQIEEHQAVLQLEKGEPVSFESAASDWYRTIYRPLCDIIEHSSISDSFPDRTTADLYTYITLHHWSSARKRRYGIGVEKLIPKDMEAFREKMADKKQVGYPEMQRGIIAFVLMTVQARKEFKIVDKLFELDEVREVHSVHGDADILVKVVLTRDLLSSDAETISEFVHNRIRQLPGVNATKTLIPGYSKSKEVSARPEPHKPD
jgi:DNA-binding Lrp family transcriptional regulator/uncharacterized ParB-like nuclease family protein